MMFLIDTYLVFGVWTVFRKTCHDNYYYRWGNNYIYIKKLCNHKTDRESYELAKDIFRISSWIVGFRFVHFYSSIL